MRIVVANKILEMLNLEQTSDNYQKVYKMQDLILEDVDDSFVYETAVKRELVSEAKCKVCGRSLERYYSSNGVLDSEKCPKVNSSGEHSKSFLSKFSVKF